MHDSGPVPSSPSRPDRSPNPSPNRSPSRTPVLFLSEDSSIFNGVAGKPERIWLPWAVAAITVVGLLGLLFWLGRGSSLPVRPGIDPYAKYLVFGHIQVSQASNFAGDQITYVDGTVKNSGDRTVTFVLLQALFANDSGEPSQIEQAPIQLIRSRLPYVETEPVSADPLTPGQSQDFRLTFENISSIWNRQAPHIQVLRVATRP